MAISNVNVGDFMSRALQKTDNMATNLEAKMKEVTAGGGELKQADLLVLQYQMGQYQAYMTMMNNTVSSIQGHMKEMANSIR